MKDGLVASVPNNSANNESEGHGRHQVRIRMAVRRCRDSDDFEKGAIKIVMMYLAVIPSTLRIY